MGTKKGTDKTIDDRDQKQDEEQPREVIELHAVGYPSRKRSGEATEAEFVARVAGMNLRVAKPWGESDPYDVLVGYGRGFWRVQVKCAPQAREGHYVAKSGNHSGPYTKEQIDFIAARVVRENIWYIVPVEAIQTHTCLHFHPCEESRARYEIYREAWCLLVCPPKARGWNDTPVVCRCQDLTERCAVCPNR